MLSNRSMNCKQRCMSDEQLIREITAGNDAAFKTLMERYQQQENEAAAISQCTLHTPQ